MKRPWLLVLLFVAVSCGGRSTRIGAGVGGSAGADVGVGVGGSRTTGAEAGVGANATGDGGFGGATGGTAPSGGSSVAASGGNALLECATGTPIALPRSPASSPPAIVLLLDASAEAAMMAPSGGSVWDNTAAAVSDVMGVLPDGLQLGAFSFPDVLTPGQHACPTMLRAELAALDAPERLQLNSVLSSVGPGGPRDLEQAYNVALAPPWGTFATGREALIVVTTGLPTHDLDCQPFAGTPSREDIAPLFDAVAQASASSVDTYVIGSYGSTNVRDVLSELAVTAGTEQEPCKDQGGSDYCHFDISWSNDVRGQLDVVLWSAVRDELERSGCRLTLPGWVSAPSTLSIVSGNGTVSLGPSSGDVRCETGWQGAPLEPSDGDAGAAVTLCTASCFDYLADPTAQIVACANASLPRF